MFGVLKQVFTHTHTQSHGFQAKCGIKMCKNYWFFFELMISFEYK